MGNEWGMSVVGAFTGASGGSEFGLVGLVGLYTTRYNIVDVGFLKNF